MTSILTEGTSRTALVAYGIADAEIATLKAKFMQLSIKGINDTGGYQQVHSARMVIKNHRVDVEKRRKELKADALEFGRKVDAEARRLTLLLEPIESHLEAEEKAIDDEKERIRNEARLKAEAEERSKREAEEARLRAEREAEAERLRVERQRLVEQQREIEEERRKIEAEKQRLANIEIERQRVIDAENKRLADIEAAKQRQIELDMARVEAAERARIETEQRIAREQEAARLKAEQEAEAKRQREARAEAKRKRQEELLPDKEKLCAVAEAILRTTLPNVSDSARPTLERVRHLLSEAAKQIRELAEELE